MAMYSAKNLQNKLNGGFKSKAFNLEKDVTYQFWFPVDSVYARKMHYNIHDVKKFRNSDFKAVQCIRYDIESEGYNNGKKCPVCDHIRNLWKQWKESSDENIKKQILTQINRLESVEYYINAVLISAKDKERKSLDIKEMGVYMKCLPLRLTKTMFKNLCETIESCDITDVVWRIKKSGDKKIEYSMIEEINTESSERLKSLKDKIINRPEEKGGLIDLEKLIGQVVDEDTYVKKLLSTDEDDDELDAEELLSDDEPKKQPTKQAKKVVIEDEDISLDDLDSDIEEKPKKEQPKAKSDDLDDFDFEETPKPKEETKKAKADELDDFDFEETPKSKKETPKKESSIDLDDFDEDSIPF